MISSTAFKKGSYGNYLKTNRDRSRDADYKKVHMPDFYFERVKRNFGADLFKGIVTNAYKVAIEELKAVDQKSFLLGLDAMLGIIQKIEKRGGKVILVPFSNG